VIGRRAPVNGYRGDSAYGLEGAEPNVGYHEQYAACQDGDISDVGDGHPVTCMKATALPSASRSSPFAARPAAIVA
jgi:hypothetical protein